MNSNKVLASLCYFSIFFAGFIFPIVVYFVADDQAVKQHAKKAFLSHLIPAATILLFIISAIFAGLTGGRQRCVILGRQRPSMARFCYSGGRKLGRCRLEYYQRDSGVKIT
nr:MULTISPECIES: DUF4870 domain-containing protein [unclassified Geobacillus]